MKNHNFLIEIGTDELPPKILKELGIDFSRYISTEFKNNKIYFNTMKWFAAPRHLAVLAKISIIKQNALCQDNYLVCDCLDSHYQNLQCCENNTHSLQKSIDNSHIQQYPKYQNNSSQKTCIYSKSFKDLLIKIVNNALEKLKNYQMMRWNNVQVPFIRPVQTIIVLLNSCLIKGQFFEIDIKRISYGHRYIKNNIITINHANDYPDILMKKGYVIVDYYKRKKIIKTEIQKQASKLGGVVDIQDDDFLDEITASIEWPTVLFGRFNKRFLLLPSEIIIYIMKERQKYFPVYNIANGILLPCFIFVVNTITENYKKIIIGHENVLQTKFMDVEFFLKKDSQYRLEDYIPKLKSILFHTKLGSLQNKVYRIAELSSWIARKINEDISQAKRAGYLCKCDLMTNMVSEFPQAQGIIGMYYARRDGESEQVAIAQKEHYQPRYTTDFIPKEKISCIVSIADKIDTISGIFGVQEIPTSSRDPFALKRIATGILNIIIQKKLSINLIELIYKSVDLYGSTLDQTNIIKKSIQEFMYKRLYSCYCKQGYRSDVVASVLNIDFTNIIDCTSRIHVIHNFCISRNQEYFRLHLLYKRISNLLKKQNISFSKIKIEDSLFQRSEEIRLFSQIGITAKKIKDFFIKKKYDSALLEIIDFSYFINDFLNNVKIIDLNDAIRYNRLLLLDQVKLLILKVIDLSVLRIRLK